MKRVRIAVLATIVAVSLGGCGTIGNLSQGDPEIYGGLQKAVEVVQTPRKATGGGVSFNGGPFVMALALADVGLSLVGDTLTLPLAIYMRQKEHTSDDKDVPVDASNHAKSENP